ncbi:hypothetical protein WJX84_000263 [Apatococcus fuscideae]|uniref:Uncharacterized protein n=1 Tax=Apatococcus fuscideae TaxID=2026836 RepID=A0AAW1S1A4_9CHLO
MAGLVGLNALPVLESSLVTVLPGSSLYSFVKYKNGKQFQRPVETEDNSKVFSLQMPGKTLLVYRPIRGHWKMECPITAEFCSQFTLILLHSAALQEVKLFQEDHKRCNSEELKNGETFNATHSGSKLWLKPGRLGFTPSQEGLGDLTSYGQAQQVGNLAGPALREPASRTEVLTAKSPAITSGHALAAHVPQANDAAVREATAEQASEATSCQSQQAASIPAPSSSEPPGAATAGPAVLDGRMSQPQAALNLPPGKADGRLGGKHTAARTIMIEAGSVPMGMGRQRRAGKAYNGTLNSLLSSRPMSGPGNLPLSQLSVTRTKQKTVNQTGQAAADPSTDEGSEGLTAQHLPTAPGAHEQPAMVAGRGQAGHEPRKHHWADHLQPSLRGQTVRPPLPAPMRKKRKAQHATSAPDAEPNPGTAATGARHDVGDEPATSEQQMAKKAKWAEGSRQPELTQPAATQQAAPAAPTLPQQARPCGALLPAAGPPKSPHIRAETERDVPQRVTDQHAPLAASPAGMDGGGGNAERQPLRQEEWRPDGEPEQEDKDRAADHDVGPIISGQEAGPEKPAARAWSGGSCWRDVEDAVTQAKAACASVLALGNACPSHGAQANHDPKGPASTARSPPDDAMATHGLTHSNEPLAGGHGGSVGTAGPPSTDNQLSVDQGPAASPPSSQEETAQLVAAAFQRGRECGEEELASRVTQLKADEQLLLISRRHLDADRQANEEGLEQTAAAFRQAFQTQAQNAAEDAGKKLLSQLELLQGPPEK